MEDSQKKAVAVQVTYGLKLQEEHPEIVELYRNGSYIRQIVEELRLCEKYSLTKNNAARAITYALNGFNGIPSMNLMSYNGLLEEDEKNSLVREHQRTSGLEIVANGKGFFSLSDDKRRKIASEAGKKAYENGNGIHGLSYKERTKLAKEAVMARGNTPLIESNEYKIGELEFVRRLSLLQEFKYQEGRLKGNNNVLLIQEKVQNAYKTNRSKDSIRAMIRKANKKIQKSI